MNIYLISAGVLGLFTSAAHIFGGQQTLIRPFLHSDLADDVKGCLLVCWHMISAYLLLSACLYLYAGLNHTPDLSLLLNTLSGSYILFSVLFIVIGGYFFGHHTLYKLPQWILLLPIGVLGLLGT